MPFPLSSPLRHKGRTGEVVTVLGTWERGKWSGWIVGVYWFTDETIGKNLYIWRAESGELVVRDLKREAA